MANSEHLQRQQVEALFRQYGRRVGSYILARVGDAELAEAITSNVFLIVVRRIDQCRGSPVAWLWSIVRSEIARHFRQRRTTMPLSETFPDPAASPVEAASRLETSARMRAAMEQLSDEHQQIIYLKFFLDLRNTQIATELSLSPSNVGVIVHRAVRRLRDLMEQQPGNSGSIASGEQRTGN